MTRREKVLALCVGGTLGGLALVYAVNWAVLQPFQTVRDQIAEEHRRSRNLRTAYRQVENIEDEWKKLAARTLADDPQDTQRRFLEDMQHLLALHGLRDTKVAPGAFVTYKDGSHGVPLTISAAGTLKEVLGFLCDFYCRDYLARLDKVRITADQGVLGDVNTNRPRVSGGRPGGRVPPTGGRREPQYGPEGPVLKLSVSAVTLVLPPLRGVNCPSESEIVELAGGRLQRERAAYNAILDHNPFMPYQPPVAVVTPTTQRTEPANTAPTTPVVAVNPREGADQKFVRVTTCLDGEPAAYVYDEQKRDQPPDKFYLDDQIDDGRLLLILPRGLVVRVGKEDFFYPLGKSFQDREKLDPDAQPEVWEALRQETAGSKEGAAHAAGEASG
jgi:hypothetical protein